MKKGILGFKAFIRFVVSIVTSREFAFLYCLAGTVAQISHTYFLVESISSLAGTWRAVQATLLSIFISSSLLYFVSIADDEDTEASRKVHRTVTMFTVIEVLINVYYYTRHILIDPLVLNKDPNLVGYFDLAFAIMMSVMIPITIKLYASSIRAKEWIEDIEHGRDATVSGDLKSNGDYFRPEPGDIEYNGETHRMGGRRSSGDVSADDVENVMRPLVEEFQKELLSMKRDQVHVDEDEVELLVHKMFNDRVATLDARMSEAFERNSGLFLKQFENKIKNAMNKGLLEAKAPADTQKQPWDIRTQDDEQNTVETL
jgi:hypothetical protein